MCVRTSAPVTRAALRRVASRALHAWSRVSGRVNTISVRSCAVSRVNGHRVTYVVTSSSAVDISAVACVEKSVHGFASFAIKK